VVNNVNHYQTIVRILDLLEESHYELKKESFLINVLQEHVDLEEEYAPFLGKREKRHYYLWDASMYLHRTGCTMKEASQRFNLTLNQLKNF